MAKKAKGKKAGTRKTSSKKVTLKARGSGTESVAVVLVLEQKGKTFTIAACMKGREPVALYECSSIEEARRKAGAWCRRAPGRCPRPLAGAQVASCEIDDRLGAATS